MQGNRQHRTLARLALAAAALLAWPSRPSLAEGGNLKIGPDTYESIDLVGTVVRIAPTFVELNANGNLKYVVSMSAERLAELTKPFARQSPPVKFTFALGVRANADTNYLTAKQSISFLAELDAKHALRNEVSEVTVYAPGGDAKPQLVPLDGEGAKATEGRFVVNGQIIGRHDNVLTVKTYTEQGKPLTLTAHLAETATVKVELNEIAACKPGDAVQVSGYLYPKNKAPVPNAVVGEKIEFTLAKPLIGKPRSALAESKSPGKKPIDGAESGVAADMPTPAAGAAPAPRESATPKPSDDQPAEPKPTEPKRGIESRLLVRDRFTADRDLKYEYDTSLPAK